ncbi:ABC transporter permease [Levilactobacillus namurensis]|uniref:ABC transporter permease n=1 Tax=Levilactobacillus namurensis TaxID=380393 RepID=UPI0004677B03|nr:ABC-2 family transporter protein [Levilactobacillus namurensis]
MLTVSQIHAVVRTKVQQQSFYKFNLVMKIIGALFSATIQYFIWKSVSQTDYGNTETISTYAILATVYNLLLPAPSVANSISQMVLSGDISYQIIRPLSFMALTFLSQLGQLLFNLVIIALPLSVAYFGLFHIVVGVNGFVAILSSIFSAALGFILSFQIGYLIGLVAFLTNRVGGFVSLYNGLMIIFGGAVLPVTIYPEVLQTIVSYTPFYAILYIPLSGVTGSGVSPLMILTQVMWILILIPITKYMFNTYLEKISIAGG